MTRVIMTGSRTWTSVSVIRTELERLRQAHGSSLTIAVGDAKKGADPIVKEQCQRLNIDFEEYVADWHKLGKRAGYERNERMVADGASYCVAFPMPCTLQACARRPVHWTHGTKHCYDTADAAGIHVYTP